MTPSTATRQDPRPAGPGGRPSTPADAVAATTDLPRLVPARLDTPLTSYYLVLGAGAALVMIGLVMVLSSSSVESYAHNGSAYTVFARQAVFAAVGMPMFLLAARMPIKAWTTLSWPLLFGAIALQMLVFTPLGVVVNDNRNWIGIGSFTMQPAEAGKLALVVWSAAVLARKRPLLQRPMHALVPVLPGAAALVSLVLLGRDLGTALVLIALVGTVLFVAGAPLRVLVTTGGLAAVLVLLLVIGSQNRMNRISSWSAGGCAGQDYYTSCWQIIHGKWALATGGWWGVGLGASREKWGLLPEAHNDFIFAVIGEELGLVGTLSVLGLFALLAVGLCRVVLRSDDVFVKVATGGVLTWVLGQAIINIGAVLGMLPVVGVPLPMVSSGGSALVMTMAALGMVTGFARREPGAREALAARAGLVQRSLAVLPVRRDGRREARPAGEGRRR